MPFEMLIGAAIAAGGVTLGRLLPAGKRPPRPRKPPEPVCGCECDLAFHEPDGDGGGTRCHGMHEVPAPRPDYDTPYHYTEVPCTCKQYTGPRILDPGYVARELTDGTR